MSGTEAEINAEISRIKSRSDYLDRPDLVNQVTELIKLLPKQPTGNFSLLQTYV
jgi:hypothetical protein